MEIKTEEYRTNKDGFHGALYIPKADFYRGKVLIVFGGGDGSFAGTRIIAKRLARGGLTVLAVAYWKEKGLPKILKAVPIEYLGKVADFLKKKGYCKIGLWGISMGAEYALFAASLMPDKFDCVVAASPIWFGTQGVESFTKMANGAAFSFGGQEIAYQPFRQEMTVRGLLAKCLRRREFTVRFMYHDIWQSPAEHAVIPVAKMNASLLLFSGGQDSMWPAKESAERIMETLDDSGYPFPHFHVHYEHGSHYMLPVSFITDGVFSAERKYWRECRQMKEEIFQETMRFLEESW